jgi:hypothetical protein
MESINRLKNVRAAKVWRDSKVSGNETCIYDLYGVHLLLGMRASSASASNPRDTDNC